MAVGKFVFKTVGISLALAVAGAGGIVASDWLYFQRLITFDRSKVIMDVDWYDPLETVEGKEGPDLDRAGGDRPTIRADALDAAVDFAESYQSAALLIWHRGAIQLEWYGEGHGPETLTNSASMHKPVLALLYGNVIAEGFISSVDEPAAAYLTEWADDERSKITIRHLLQMSSGLSRPEFSPNPFSDGLKLQLGTDVEKIALKYRAADPPNEYFAYSNLNSQLLGIILERATGMRYAEILESYLWSKVGTSDARVWLDRPGGMVRTFTNLQTKPENWLRLGLLHINRGKVQGVQVVPESWMTKITTPSDTNPNYGLQTWLGTEWQENRGYGKGIPVTVRHSEPFLADDVVYFDGSGGQRVYAIPSHELVIVRTGPGGTDPATGNFDWDDAVLPNTIIRGIIDAAETPGHSNVKTLANETTTTQ